ncbi:MAG: hypothetical protein QE164_02695 [Candidatus Nezhaarchaeota archaeon]|nr:hypothetical protein [Candidatus Nezhaarchaeota archaeon]
MKLLSKVFSVIELKGIRGLEEEVFNLAVREGVTVTMHLTCTSR